MEHTLSEYENYIEDRINCVIAGDSFVGKTNLLLRFIDDEYENVYILQMQSSQLIQLCVKLPRVRVLFQILHPFIKYFI